MKSFINNFKDPKTVSINILFLKLIFADIFCKLFGLFLGF